MTRGETTKIGVHLKGNHNDFLVFVDDSDAYRKWKSDRSIPIAHFLSLFKVFTTGLQASQENFDAPSNSTLETEFRTSEDEAVIIKILESGMAQDMDIEERQGCRNDSFSSTRVQ